MTRYIMARFYLKAILTVGQIPTPAMGGMETFARVYSQLLYSKLETEPNPLYAPPSAL